MQAQGDEYGEEEENGGGGADFGGEQEESDREDVGNHKGGGLGNNGGSAPMSKPGKQNKLQNGGSAMGKLGKQNKLQNSGSIGRADEEGFGDEDEEQQGFQPVKQKPGKGGRRGNKRVSKQNSLGLGNDGGRNSNRFENGVDSDEGYGSSGRKTGKASRNGKKGKGGKGTGKGGSFNYVESQAQPNKKNGRFSKNQYRTANSKSGKGKGKGRKKSASKRGKGRF